MASVVEMFLTGGASNSNPNLSLGGVGSSVKVSSTSMNNLFDDIDEDESPVGNTEYRAVDLVNTGDAQAVKVAVYFSSNTSSADTDLAIGIEASPVGSTTSIANEATAPVGVSFSTSYTKNSALELPNIATSARCRLWFRRVTSPGATNTSSDIAGVKFRFS